MFTIQFYIFEVLAGSPSGLDVSSIAARGLWPKSSIRACLKSLEKEEFVKCDRGGRVQFWTMSDKAYEYCDRAAVLYRINRPLEDL